MIAESRSTSRCMVLSADHAWAEQVRRRLGLHGYLVETSDHIAGTLQQLLMMADGLADPIDRVIIDHQLPMGVTPEVVHALIAGLPAEVRERFEVHTLFGDGDLADARDAVVDALIDVDADADDANATVLLFADERHIGGLQRWLTSGNMVVHHCADWERLLPMLEMQDVDAVIAVASNFTGPDDRHWRMLRATGVPVLLWGCAPGSEAAWRRAGALSAWVEGESCEGLVERVCAARRLHLQTADIRSFGSASHCEAETTVSEVSDQAQEAHAETTAWLDTAMLETLRSYGDSVLQSLIGKFCVDARKRAQAIALALEHGDAAGLRFEAHALKGGAGAIGATVLHGRCSALEVAGAEENLATARDLHADFPAMVEDTLAALEALV